MALSGFAAGLAAELEQVRQAAGDIYVANLCTVAAAVWLGYDILATLPEEISYVWRTRWSIPKIMYIVVRYYPLVSLVVTALVGTSWDVSLSVSDIWTSFCCKRWIWLQAYNGTLLTAFLGEAMFLMRLYAAYQQSKPILVAIVSLYTAELAVGIVTATLIVTSLDVYERPPLTPFPGCVVTPPNHPKLSIMAWSVALGTTCIYFLLILYKFANTISLRRDGTSPGKVSIWELGTISPLIYAFLRDSAFYFFLVFAGNFMNLLFEIIFEGRALTVMSTNWLSAIYSVSASRVCLNTRESIQRRRFTMDTGWLGDMDPDITIAGGTDQPNRPGQVQSVDDGRNSPVIVFTRSTSKVSLQRSSFDSDARQDGFLTPSSSKDKKRSSVVTEDFELVSVLSWKTVTDEHVGLGEAV